MKEARKRTSNSIVRIVFVGISVLIQIPEEKFFRNLDRYGNTSGASIPLALYDLWNEGKLEPGTRVFCIGFGAGLTWAGACLTF